MFGGDRNVTIKHTCRNNFVTLMLKQDGTNEIRLEVDGATTYVIRCLEVIA